MHHPPLILAVALSTAPALAAELTATEQRWLSAGWDVVVYAKQQGLPLDIVVLPASSPGDAPLAMGFDEGRCKLVLSMRGNPEAKSTLDAIEPDLLQPIVEAMFAHELGHCWRYVHALWHHWPAGFRDASGAPGNSALARERRAMRDARREEGYADLVGLAWTLMHHSERYADVHAWLTRYRAEDASSGDHHDTAIWLDRVRDPTGFAASGTPFERAEKPWREGLLEDE